MTRRVRTIGPNSNILSSRTPPTLSTAAPIDLKKMRPVDPHRKYGPPQPPVPVTPKASAIKAKAPATKRSRGGANPSRPWKGLLAHLDPMVDDGTITTWREANSVARNWRNDNNKALSDSAIRRGLKNYRKHWELKD